MPFYYTPLYNMISLGAISGLSAISGISWSQLSSKLMRQVLKISVRMGSGKSAMHQRLHRLSRDLNMT